MDRAQLKDLNDNELESRLAVLCQKERAASVELLYHLIELDERQLYLRAGCSSLFDYCRRKLLYSEGAAQRRILAARCLKDNAELAELLREGRANLCTIATAAASLKAKSTTWADIAGKSKKEVESIVARADPKPRPREVIKPLVVKPVLKCLTSNALRLPLMEGVKQDNAALLMAAAKAGDKSGDRAGIKDGKSCQREQSPAPLEERFEIRFSVSKELFHKFKTVRAKLSSALGRDLSFEAVFTRLIDLELKEVRGRKAANRQALGSPCLGSGDGRHISAAAKREVFKRDGGQCTYVAPDGTRCTERNYLQIDHVQPYALGGESEVSNLRLLCGRHNRFEAGEIFGYDYMKRFRATATGGGN